MLSSKLIDGVYPNYRQVIPSGCEERVTIEREQLLSALRRVSVVTTDKSNATRLTFSANQLTITTNTPDVIAVSRIDKVIFAKRRNGTDTGRFLTDIQVTETADLPFAVFLRCAFLEPADEKHIAVHLYQLFVGKIQIRPTRQCCFLFFFFHCLCFLFR
jgi:hypothetical protein